MLNHKPLKRLFSSLTLKSSFRYAEAGGLRLANRKFKIPSIKQKGQTLSIIAERFIEKDLEMKANRVRPNDVKNNGMFTYRASSSSFRFAVVIDKTRHTHEENKTWNPPPRCLGLLVQS